MKMASDSSNDAVTPEEREALELILEAARRANWDALHGPAHLRAGRYLAQETPAVAREAAQPGEPNGSTPPP